MTVNFARLLYFLKYSNLIKKCAFTLAEVLITLGIIGVVAAMTLPVLVQNYQKHVTAIKIKRFYSIINQAVKMSIVDNDEPSNWDIPLYTSNFNTDIEFVNKYFSPYIKLMDCKSFKYSSTYTTYDNVLCAMPSGDFIVFEPDGKRANIGDRLYIKYVSDNKCLKENFVGNTKFYFKPRCVFDFSLNDKELDRGRNKDQNNFIIPYESGWDGTVQGLTKAGGERSCSKNATRSNSYCAKYIQISGWKIPKDYPW